VEQWTGFEGAVSGFLSYCRDTTLRGVKWSTEVSTRSIKKKKGTVTWYYMIDDDNCGAIGRTRIGGGNEVLG
jgi:hypothetical protein